MEYFWQNIPFFCILLCIVGIRAMHHIPVLRGDHRHIGNREIFIQRIKGCGCAASTAADNCRTGFIGKIAFPRIKSTVEYSVQGSRRSGKMNGRTEDEPITRCCFLYNRIDRVILKNTAAGFAAGTAIDTAVDSRRAKVIDFRLDAFFL